ncbi:MAG: aminomethyltransferase family protein [Atopobiaceae bacterium]|nr:aminomethyltransferase family protein [Atopobiaceae bacterium]
MNKNVYKYDDMKRSEHMAMRTTAGWYLWTHQLIEVTCEDATVFLAWLYTAPIKNLAVGRDRYTTMLNADAEIIDDVVIMRMGEQRYWISTLFKYKLLDWLRGHKKESRVEWKDITDEWHMFTIQGPNSKDMVNALVENPIDDLKFFSFADNAIDGVPVIVNRAGFTGEKFGYEIYLAKDKYAWMVDKLKETAPKFGAKQVTEFQIMAWTLPTEAGYYYMRDLLYTNPLEVGLDKGIDWDKKFIGKKALLKVKEAGPAREMVGFTLEEADVRINGKDQGAPGSVVTLDGEEIGRVSKFNYSFVQEKPVGYLLVDKGSVKIGDHVTINHRYDAVICEKKFL